MDFAVLVECKENKIDKYLDFARELKKTVELKVEGDTDCNWCARNDLQKLG